MDTDPDLAPNPAKLCQSDRIRVQALGISINLISDLIDLTRSFFFPYYASHKIDTVTYPVHQEEDDFSDPLYITRIRVRYCYAYPGSYF
jgi:hypothetical protein